MKVHPIPLFSDNYSYLIVNENEKRGALVDPADAEEVWKVLTKQHEGILITAILLTHKHWDHAGGFKDLTKKLLESYASIPEAPKKIEVYCGAEENLEGTTIPIKEPSSFTLNNLSLKAFPSPCHTRGHCLYLLESDAKQTAPLEYSRVIFTGDTLFNGGCGKFFEGNGEEMYNNFKLIASLPEDTHVFNGHEYTCSNLEWAEGIDWENPAYSERLAIARELRKNNKFTVPSTISEEKKSNIFMRCDDEELQKKVGAKGAADCMGKLRQMKDNKPFEDMDFQSALPHYLRMGIFQSVYMTLAWILCVALKNGSMVDFAWPSGFLLQALYFYFMGDGYTGRKILITSLFVIAGLRFNMGWIFGRKHYKREDHRWELWRERWRKGEGFLGIKNVSLNFFFFYHAQSAFNALVLSLPMMLLCFNKTPGLYWQEILGLVLWVSSFLLENVADSQLAKFKLDKAKRSGVMKEGLWKYSRHPNYFFEWMLYVAYLIMTIPSSTESWHCIILFFLPGTAYYFLIHFTGVPMAEKGSLARRGKEYADYQASTNMFVPWFPRKLKSA